VAFKINIFPDIDQSKLFEPKNEEDDDETPFMVRNRGSSVEGSSDEDSKIRKRGSLNDDLSEYFNSKTKPLHVKIEILIKILQKGCLDSNAFGPTLTLT